MNFQAILPPPNIVVNRPKKISNNGNLYRIPITHTNAETNTVNNFEVWTTKEAIQKHFAGMMTEEPKEYELKKFARQMYEKQLRSSGGRMEHKGILVTSDSITHGNPSLWPNNISHPEVRI